MAKAAKSTPPPFVMMEPRGHLCTAAPEFMWQMLRLKVYTNRDGQPRVTVPTTTMTNTIPCSCGTYMSPCMHQVKLRLQVKCQTCLWEPKLSVSWLMFTFTNRRQKGYRSLFICSGRRRWFSWTNANAPLQLSREAQNRAESLPVQLRICRGRLSPSADGRLWQRPARAPRSAGLSRYIGAGAPWLLRATQASELIPNDIFSPAKRKKRLNSLFQESGGVCIVHWRQPEKIPCLLILPNSNQNISGLIYQNYPSKQRDW